MKRFTLIFCVLMMLIGMQAVAQETHNVVASYYSVRADAPNHAVFYSLTDANDGKTFNFYLYLEVGRHDIEWGKNYTLSDMNADYCYWQEDAVTAYGMVQASFKKTKGEGYAVNITAHVMDNEGEEFDITYTEDPLVLTGDTVKLTFTKQAHVERRNSEGTWHIEAGNDTISCRVQFYSADEKSCAGTFAGDDVYLPSCYVNVATGKYEYDVPVYDRIFAKDASVVATDDDKRIEAHAMIVGENGKVYDFTMAFDKPEVEDSVTITSDSLLIDAQYYSMFHTVQLSASDGTYKTTFWFEPAGLDSLIAGTYIVGEKEFDGWVVNLETKEETWLYSGSITVTYDDEAYYVEGALLCKNKVKYILHLSRPKPAPTRADTIVVSRGAMAIDGDGWDVFGENADHTKCICIFSPSTTVAGHYTEKDLIVDYSFIGTDLDPDGGKTNKYFSLKEADLTVTFNTEDSVAHITGTMFCISVQDPNDRPLFTIDMTTAMDGPFFDDDTTAFSAEFPTYEVNRLMVEDVGSVLIEAYNPADGAFVALQIFVAEEETDILPGAYPLTDSGEPMTTLASRGMYASYATYSIAGYANENHQFSRIWFLVSGTVLIGENGEIEVKAVNSNDRKVQCKLLKEVEAVEQVSAPENARGQKKLREGMLIIEQNGKTYNTQGAEIQ